MSAKIPVILITGFLGAGKTTFVNALLRDPRFSDTAILINEFGETPIDNDLILEFSSDLVVTTTGCICCTASSDVRQSLFALWHRRTRREIRAFTRVIIETTGLADPAPVVHALTLPPSGAFMDRIASDQFGLHSVLTLLDAETGLLSVDEHLEALKQVALADAVVLTKGDRIASEVARESLRRQISAGVAAINPLARAFDRDTDFDAIADWILSERCYDRVRRPADALAWLQAEVVMGAHAPHGKTARSAHDGAIRAHCITLDEPVSPLAFNVFLSALQRSAGTSLLRVKGLFALSDDPGRPVVVHGVRHVVQSIDKLAAWPSADTRTRVVLIGRDLNIEAMRSVLETRNRPSGWLGFGRKSGEENLKTQGVKA